MKTYYPYAPYSPEEVLGELHTITDGCIVLKNIPFENSIDIEGFKQTNSVNLEENQFYCAYGADQLYRESNCTVYFHPAHNGEKVRVDYLHVGTVLDANDLNEIKAHLENATLHSHSNYALPAADKFTRGGVRVGKGLTIVGDVLNVADTVGGGYTLPAASSTTLGGIKIGNGLSIDTLGVVSAAENYTLTTASETLLGGVKIGEGLSMQGQFLTLTLGTTPLSIEGAMWLED